MTDKEYIAKKETDKQYRVKQSAQDLRTLLLLFSLVFSLVFSAGMLAGCAAGSATIAPPTIRYGEDLCAECGMIISDPRYAAGYAYEVGEGRYESLAFDDIGDLLAHMTKHPERKVVAWYVHDYASEEWLDATAAYYVIGETIYTPMGHGIAAHATEAAAAAMAEEHAGVVLDWEALLEQS